MPFYRTPGGARADGLLAAAVETAWGDCGGLRVAVLGTAGPALGAVAGKAGWGVGLRSGTQEPGPNSPRCQVVVETDSLPVADSVFDRVLLLHPLESEAQGAAVLREVWRMMAPEGRVLVVVPNVFGSWAWCGRHPFRRARPVTAMRLRRWLSVAAFKPQKVWGVLRAPPLPSTLYVRVAAAWERVPVPFPGVWLADGRKRLHLPVPSRPAPRRIRPLLAVR